MELLVGKVIKCEKHPDADKLYVETVDCGEPGGPRTICSGLVPYMSTADIDGKNVVVVANLKPRKMAGLASAGMLLCANNGGDGDARKVELLLAPDGVVAGRGSRGATRARTTRRTGVTRSRRNGSGRRCSRTSG